MGSCQSSTTKAIDVTSNQPSLLVGSLVKQEVSLRFSAMQQMKSPSNEGSLHIDQSHDNDGGMMSPYSVGLQLSPPGPVVPIVSINATRRLKRKLAKIAADSEDRWLLFSSTEVFDDNSLRLLALFMEIAMKFIPDVKDDELMPHYHRHMTSSMKVRSLALLLENVGSPRLSRSLNGSVESIGAAAAMPLSPKTVGRRKILEKRLSLEQISVEDLSYSAKSVEEERFTENEVYNLSNGSIDAVEVLRVVDIFKSNAKLSLQSVHRLLRESYHILKSLPNITTVALQESEMVTVVGDIHGQLNDLLHILDESGLPDLTHKYVFNGDFVDRGENGVEVMCLLLAMFIAHGPQRVVLNRGNHEDFVICSIYGFQKEVLAKYDEATFAMFVEVFNWLPLYTVINETIFIVHGGLFHSPQITLGELNEIKRYDCSLLEYTRTSLSHGKTIPPVAAATQGFFYHQQLQKETLWSDPKTAMGIGHSSRGAGVAFGPDITKQFLEYNHLKFVIRSHECVRSGFERPYVGCGTEYENLLCTLFSASSYSDGNTAAYMEIFPGTHHMVKKYSNDLISAVDDQLSYIVHHFNAQPGMDFYDSDDATTVVSDATAAVANAAAILPMWNLVKQMRNVLIDSFHLHDPTESYVVPDVLFHDVMEHILKYRIDWLMVLENFCRLNGQLGIDTAGIRTVIIQQQGIGEEGELSIPAVNYMKLIQMFEREMTVTEVRLADSLLAQQHQQQQQPTSSSSSSDRNAFVNVLYSNKSSLLEYLFQFFDIDQDCLITMPEFHHQCQLVNLYLSLRHIYAIIPFQVPSESYSLVDIQRIVVNPSEGEEKDGEQLVLLRLSEGDVTAIFHIMNVKESGEVDLNLFMESFRLANSFLPLSQTIEEYYSDKELSLWDNPTAMDIVSVNRIYVEYEIN